VLHTPIGREEIERAGQLLLAYQRAREPLYARIKENEQMFSFANTDKRMSAWSFNCISNKHADAMDALPRADLLAREQDDVAEAKLLSSILPVILERNNFEALYDSLWWYKLKFGAGCYGVFWNPEREGGKGDIEIAQLDLLDLYWDPAERSLQDSGALFCTRLCDRAAISESYPELAEPSGDIFTPEAFYGTNESSDDRVLVVDWYYKQKRNGRQIVQLCKFAEGKLLFSSENLAHEYPYGWYDHGKYPFVVDRLFPLEGSALGFGYLDVCKHTQRQIDALDSALVKNALIASSPRFFVRDDGAVNESEFADLERDLVHVAGNLDEISIRQMEISPLPQVYSALLDSKIDELKETTGNRDFTQGGTAGGVTAASAIAALQESGNKLSRDMVKCSYRAFSEVVLFCVELIRQFYGAERMFRIESDGELCRYVSYSNAALRARGESASFDIKISAKQTNPYSKSAQNELAMKMYSLGLFGEGREGALACIAMMDFDGKGAVMRSLSGGLSTGE